jgi:hypothetical protein
MVHEESVKFADDTTCVMRWEWQAVKIDRGGIIDLFM